MLKRALTSAAAALVAAACAFGSTGCAGHEDRTRTALEALDRGQPRAAVAALNEELEVKSEKDLPILKGDNALLLLDRGTVLQSIDAYEWSQRDFGRADKAIDLLDMSRGAADELGKYLFSDSAGPYKAPAYEKLLINTMNLVNYLALHDLSGAKVEARRLAIMQKYVRDHEEASGLTGIGSWLAGFAFEKAGDNAEARNWYEDALKYAQYPSLRDPLRVIARDRRTPAVDALIGGEGPLPPVSETGEAELVVVIGFGRTPQKMPARVPIGLALTMVAGGISPENAAAANALAAKGLVTWINFPTLRPGRGGYAIPTLTIDGRGHAMEQALDVEAQVREAWKKNEGTMILAAITRMIARAVAGEIVQGATTAAAGGDRGGGGALGLIAGLATTATLSVLDTPDTRAWSTLPARIALARLRLPPGDHEVRVGARGETKIARIRLERGGWGLVSMLALR